MNIRLIARLAALVCGLSLGLSAQAATKRYLLRFKSTATFAAMSTHSTGNLFPSLAQAFSTHTRVTKALPNVHLMVLESDDALSIEALKSRADVAMVEEEIFFPLPKQMRVYPQDASVTAAPSAPIPMPWGIAAVNAPEAWPYSKGSGARVMVLDTGVDTGHEALAGQIEAVQNFNGGPVDDVTDDVGHGTHVSGTILANGLNGGLVGVAPQAKLLMGKVCDTQGCGTIGIASGLDWAIQEKVDVVNMSLGGPLMSPAEAQAVQEAEAAGVMIVAASGNDGKGIVSYPGAVATVLAVGAIDSTLTKATFSNWGPQLGVVGPGVDVYSSIPRGTGRIGDAEVDLGDGKGLNAVNNLMLDGSPDFADTSNQLVFANLGQPIDFTNINVKGKFALIARGTIAFKDKVNNAAAAGAVAVVIFNNAPGLVNGIITSDGTPDGAKAAIPAVMIEQTVGQAAQAALQSGLNVQAQIGVLKTDYAAFDGTSMATPHVSGVAALVRAANKSLTPAQVRDLLKKTATPIASDTQNQTGSGLVNAQAAVSNAVTMIPQF